MLITVVVYIQLDTDAHGAAYFNHFVKMNELSCVIGVRSIGSGEDSGPPIRIITYLFMSTT